LVDPSTCSHHHHRTRCHRIRRKKKICRKPSDNPPQPPQPQPQPQRKLKPLGLALPLMTTCRKLSVDPCQRYLVHFRPSMLRMKQLHQELESESESTQNRLHRQEESGLAPPPNPQLRSYLSSRQLASPRPRQDQELGLLLWAPGAIWVPAMCRARWHMGQVHLAICRARWHMGWVHLVSLPIEHQAVCHPGLVICITLQCLRWLDRKGVSMLSVPRRRACQSRQCEQGRYPPLPA